MLTVQDLWVCKALLLGLITDKVQPSHKIVEHMEKNTDFKRDDINYAYWILLGEGAIIREAGGVRRAINFSGYSVSFTTSHKISTSFGNID